jgi:hypothetical protein
MALKYNGTGDEFLRPGQFANAIQEYGNGLGQHDAIGKLRNLLLMSIVRGIESKSVVPCYEEVEGDYSEKGWLWEQKRH